MISVPPSLANHEVPVSSVRARFGNYRAEWFRSEHDFVELFVEPEYFPELSDDGCCLLVGRRGTGKTSALRGLSYQSVDERSGWRADSDAIGLYYKFDIGIAGAMTGDPLSGDEWSRVFGHYLNLAVMSLAIGFAGWVEDSGRSVPSTDKGRFASLRAVGERFLGGPCESLDAMSKLLGDQLFDLETSINAIGPSRARIDTRLTTSAAAMAPLSAALLDDIGATTRTKVFFLFDELETLTVAQQQVVNTVIKQSNNSYAVKVCSKERGWKTRATIVPDQVLSAPADYSLIDIDRRLSEGPTYARLAERICRKRIGSVIGDEPMTSVFPGLRTLEEAELLGLRPAEVSSDLESLLANRFRLDPSALLEELDPLDQYVLRELFKRRGGVGPGGGRHAVVTESVLKGTKDVRALRSLISNYRIPALFTIRSSTRGDRRIFTGWRTLLQLSGGTIRHLMQMIEWAIASAEQNRPDSEDGLLSISVEDQHFATRQVAEVYLREIRSFSPLGAELCNVAIGIGQFQALLLRNAFAHAPDLNQFTIEGGDRSLDDVGALVDRAIMEGVFLRKRRTKRPKPSDIPTDEFRLNPVLAPYFPFSPTEKRAYRVYVDELLTLSSDPQRGLLMLASRYDEVPDDSDTLF